MNKEYPRRKLTSSETVSLHINKSLC